MSEQIEVSEVPKRKLELRKESLTEMTGWDIRELSGPNGTVTTTCDTWRTCGNTTGLSACCPPPPYN